MNVKSFILNSKGQKILIGFLFLFFFFSFISAAPPVTQVQQIQAGYTIQGTPQQIIMQNQNFQYNFFVYNITNGMEKTNVSMGCYFYLSDNEGTLKFFLPVYYQPQGYWGINIAKGNFTTIGYYPYGVKCNSSVFGGTYVDYFEVTNSGKGANPNYIWIVLALAVGVLILGFSIKDGWVTILGSIGLSYVGLNIILFGINGVKDNVYSWAWGLIVLMVAIYVMVKSAIEMIEDVL